MTFIKSHSHPAINVYLFSKAISMVSESDSAVDDIENIFEPHFKDQEQDTAIQILDLHKRYRNYGGSKIVLNGLNLNCQTGKLLVQNCLLLFVSQ